MDKLEDLEKRYNEECITERLEFLLSDNETLEVKSSLFLEQFIKEYEPLYETHNLSMRNRYQKGKKNEQAIIKYKNNKFISLLNRNKQIYKLLSHLLRKILIAQLAKETKKNNVKIKVRRELNLGEYSGLPIIFVPTHGSKYDIESVFQEINRHAILLTGNQDIFADEQVNLFLQLNGVNYLNRASKQDRKKIYELIKKDLLDLIDQVQFLESTWNVTPNKLVNQTSFSAVNLSILSNAIIVPVALDLDKDNDTMNLAFGDPFKADIKEGTKEELIEQNNILRDQLATLMWSLYELKPNLTREEIDDFYYHKFIKSLLEDWLFMDLYEDNNYIYQPNDDAHNYFEEFNSVVTYENGIRKVKRITSERNGI
ncbi:MAG: hypothetical protein R3Y21_03920 [Mycoplasmatota bacterium]